MMKISAKAMLIGAACAALGIAAAVWNLPREDSPPPDVLQLPLRGLEGEKTSYAQLPPSRRLVNVWATWCAPCIHEMPLLAEAAKAMPQIHFSGIAVDDPILVKPFLKKVNVDYDIYTAAFNMFWLFEQGGNPNGSLPWTILLDEKGNVVADKIGEFHSAAEIGRFVAEGFN